MIWHKWHNQVAYRIPPLPQGRPRRINNRNFIASNNHEQPRRGVRLFASTEQPVYRLSPSS